MALNVVSKINTRLNFLYRKNKLLSPQLRRLLCNALMHAFRLCMLSLAPQPQ